METDIRRMQLETEARLGSQTMVEVRPELSSEPMGLECRVKYSFLILCVLVSAHSLGYRVRP